MTLDSEPINGSSPEIPSLDEVIAQFDATDLNLQMAYSRYMEKPAARRMSAIVDKTGLLFDSYGHILRKLIHDNSDSLSGLERAQIVASILHDMNTKHSVLLVEYTDAIELPSSVDSEHARNHLVELLNDEAEDSNSAFLDEALGRFKGILESDMEVIDHYAFMRASSTTRVIGEKALKTGIEIGKVSSGVMVGMFIFNKFNKR